MDAGKTNFFADPDRIFKVLLTLTGKSNYNIRRYCRSVETAFDKLGRK